MGRGSLLLVLLTGAVLTVGCSADADEPRPAASATEAAYDGPASLTNPLGVGLLGVDPATLGDVLLDEVDAAGGLRATVTGSGYDTVVEVDASPDDRRQDPRRFTWQQGGVEREQLHLPSGRVCVNRASNDALVALLSSVMHGTIVLSDRPYSCTSPSTSGIFLSSGLADLDPLSLVAGIDEWSGLTDLGTETGPDGVATRHLQLDGVRGYTMTEPTPWDLWIDGDLHLARVEFDGNVATFAYGPVPEVALPPARDRGGIQLVTYPVGSYHGPRGPAPTTNGPATSSVE